jgi:hypothetical protein
MGGFKTGQQVYEEPQKILPYSGVVSAIGNTTIVIAPGLGQRIVVVNASFQNTTQNATTILLCQTNQLSVFFRWLLGTTYSEGHFRTVLGREFRLDENTPLVVNLSAANAINVNALYFLERT